MKAETSDAVLIKRGQAGDKTAVSQLITRHRPRVRRVLRAMLSNPGDVEDILQETFLRAYLGLDTLRQPARFRAWVCGIAVNLARMQLRAPARRWRSWDELEALGLDLPDWQPSPERMTERRETAQRLRAAVGDLPPSEREALLLVYWEGFSHQETAVSLGASLSAVKVRVHRGRNRLRTALHQEFGPGARPWRRSRKERTMIPIQIHDVLMRVPEIDPKPYLQPVLDLLPAEKRTDFLADVTMNVWHGMGSWEVLASLPQEQGKVVRRALTPLMSHRVVLLKEAEGDRALPIWIGPYEAEAVAVKLRDQSLQRPITHDLLKAMLDLSGTSVVQAAVSRLEETVFYGTLTVRAGAADETTEVDCRPSDALSLAVRLDVPFLVAPDVMEQHGVLPDKNGRYAFGDDKEDPSNWRSLLQA